jgi:hypothetical protein
MRISKIFNLTKSQYELDFVDIDINHDLPLFLDPYYLSLKRDNWSTKASLTVKSFFQKIIDLIRRGKDKEARKLMQYLGEPNETCLGLSQGRPQGRGVGPEQAEAIFQSLLKSKAVKTGLVEDLEDCHIFVDNIGKDKISDMTTNIIKKHLIEYTIAQCALWGIDLKKNVPSGYYWNRETAEWENVYTEYLVVKSRKILLVPKGVVSYSDSYTPQKYYQHFVLNFLKHEHLRLGTHLVKTKIKKNGEETSRVFKKDVAKENPLSKEFLIGFTEKHPDIFATFRKESAKVQKSIDNEDLTDHSIDLESLCEHLIAELDKVSPGNLAASHYHRLIVGILELLFYPSLICPQVEREIHEGRKRIDLTFDNAAKDGFFYQLHTISKIPCAYIFVECKNYAADPANPELDQLAGRFSTNRGKFGILCCRSISEFVLFIKRCRDTFRDDRGLIIPLMDKDLSTSLQALGEGDINNIFDLLNTRKRDIILN